MAFNEALAGGERWWQSLEAATTIWTGTRHETMLPWLDTFDWSVRRHMALCQESVNYIGLII